MKIWSEMPVFHKHENKKFLTAMQDIFIILYLVLTPLIFRCLTGNDSVELLA